MPAPLPAPMPPSLLPAPPMPPIAFSCPLAPLRPSPPPLRPDAAPSPRSPPGPCRRGVCPSCSGVTQCRCCVHGAWGLRQPWEASPPSDLQAERPGPAVCFGESPSRTPGEKLHGLPSPSVFPEAPGDGSTSPRRLAPCFQRPAGHHWQPQPDQPQPPPRPGPYSPSPRPAGQGGLLLPLPGTPGRLGRSTEKQWLSRSPRAPKGHAGPGLKPAPAAARVTRIQFFRRHTPSFPPSSSWTPRPRGQDWEGARSR